MLLNRVVFHVCFRKTPWACVKATSQDFTHNAEFEVGQCSRPLSLISCFIHVFFNWANVAPSATDFYAHQAAAGMACLVLANELFLAVKRVSLLGNKRRNTGCCQH